MKFTGVDMTLHTLNAYHFTINIPYKIGDRQFSLTGKLKMTAVKKKKVDKILPRNNVKTGTDTITGETVILDDTEQGNHGG